MSKSSLIDAFDVKPKLVKVDNITDYEIFRDKDLLDTLRNSIIENLYSQIDFLREKRKMEIFMGCSSSFYYFCTVTIIFFHIYKCN